MNADEPFGQEVFTFVIAVRRVGTCNILFVSYLVPISVDARMTRHAIGQPRAIRFLRHCIFRILFSGLESELLVGVGDGQDAHHAAIATGPTPRPNHEETAFAGNLIDITTDIFNARDTPLAH
jgi:hypothetical protein